jgi:hypothetical protein
VARTQETLDALRDELERNCGDFYGACKAVGVSPGFVRRWQSEDAEIAAQLAEAKSVGALGLIHAAKTRAVDGVVEEIYYQGEVVGEKRVYSDGLLTTMLKANLPEYAAGGGTSVTVNLANIVQTMPRASNYQEWLDMQKPLALPAPEDAEYSICLPVPEEDPAMADIL